MGKKGKWFAAVKKAFSPESKEKNGDEEQETPKSKKKWGFSKQKATDLNSTSQPETCNRPSVVPPPPTPVEDIKLPQMENEPNKHAYSMALATVKAAEAAIVAAHAAAEVIQLTATSTTTRFSGKSREEVASIKIQSVYRGYLARRALRALKGLVRLKLLVNSDSIKRQSTTTLRCMQTLARVQSQIRSRRIRMTEENQALQKQLQLRREKELEALKAYMGDNWDDSLQSKEQIEASLVSKHEAAIKRERALAYAYTHQWKNSLRSVSPLFTDPNNLSWGWNWLERMMPSRPPENQRITVEKDDHASSKCLVGGEIVSHQSPSTPALSMRGMTRPARSMGEIETPEDDTRSNLSLQSERYSRRSIAGSSVGDNESTNSPSIPSYMTPTQSARAKSRFLSLHMNDTPDSVFVGSVKKQLSFPAIEKKAIPPATARRQSRPPKVSSI